MASHTPDRFDRLPADLERVGAHRSTQKQGRGWVGFAWAALATGILVVGGLFGLSVLGNVDLGLPTFGGGAGETPTPSATPTPTAAPLTDPATLAAGARHPDHRAQRITDRGPRRRGRRPALRAGWPVGAMTQASASRRRDDVRLLLRPAQRGCRARHRDHARRRRDPARARRVDAVEAPIAVVLGRGLPGRGHPRRLPTPVARSRNGSATPKAAENSRNVSIVLRACLILR